MLPKILPPTCILVMILLMLCDSYRISDLDFGASNLFEKGHGETHRAAHHGRHGEKGDRGYKSVHQEAKGSKGSHDNEGHKTAYAELDGIKKAFQHNGGFFAEKHKGEKGDRGYDYNDHGRFSKGHKTNGSHNVHKIDEYKKKTEFYDEDHDEGHKERHGGYEIRKNVKNGGYHKKGHKNRSFLEDLFRKLDQFNKGSHLKTDAGYAKAAGKDSYYKQGEEYAKKGELDEFKKFGFSEGH